MAITSPGIGSGLDVTSIVSQLMAIERQPLDKLNVKEASYQSTISAIGSLKGVLSSLQGAVATLTKEATFAGSYKTSSSNSESVTASASSGATVGNYNVSVTTLAQAQKLRTANTYTGIGDAFGSGKINIQFGTTTLDPLDEASAIPPGDPLNPTLVAGFSINANKPATTIEISSEKSSLLDVRDAINAAKAGVTASIVNDGTGYRLAISSNESGSANSLKITVEDSDGIHTDSSGLSALTFDGTSATRNLKISQIAKDAIFNVDGIPIIKPSNTVTDAIDGVTLTLNKEGTSGNINVSFDRAGISTAIQSFAKAYNETNKTLREMTGYDPATKKSGVLQGDAVARTIQSQLRTVMSGSLNFAAGGISNLSQIGISFDRAGVMTIDQAKLNTAINDPTKDIATVFTAVAKVSDTRITALSTTGKPVPGRYAVSVDQLATQGFSDSILNTTTITAGSNDAFEVEIDGVAASITLAAGAYTAESLAGEIQSKLNGVASIKSAGSSVKVNYGFSSITTGNSPANMANLVGGTFDVLLDGVSKTITVDSGLSYNGDPSSLAADLQSKLNAAFNVTDIRVALSNGNLAIHSDGNKAPAVIDGGTPALVGELLFGTTQSSITGAQTLNITSKKYGSTSSITALTSSILSGNVSVAGVDVAGTIGSTTAVGNGQELTAGGAAKGIRLNVSGGSLGSRGTVTYEKGFAERLNELLDGFVAIKGTLGAKTKGLQDSIKTLDTRREELSRRLTMVETRYRKQFTSLDTMMARMTATQSSLQQQLAGLAKTST